jgi:hypothetical protein
MPFGKYKGYALENLDDGYFEWLCDLRLREPLRKAVFIEAKRRGLYAHTPYDEATPTATPLVPCDGPKSAAPPPPTRRPYSNRRVKARPVEQKQRAAEKTVARVLQFIPRGR